MGYEAADVLGKEGGRLAQTDTSRTWEEAKLVIKITYTNKWTNQGPGHQ